MAAHLPVIVEDALQYPGNNFDPGGAVFELHDGDDPIARCPVNGLFALFAGYPVRNRQVTTELFVDGVHHLPEELSVRTGVFELIHTDIIMYHLMNDGIFYLLFSQVYPCNDAQFEAEPFRFPPAIRRFL